VVDRTTWPVPPIFEEIRRLGPVADDEMARVFNLGVGMVAVVAGGDRDAALSALAAAGVAAVTIGRVEAGPRGVVLVGEPGWPSVEPRAARTA
jgi:phosphoribosylformylglycinamidine cyclo-ligase